MKDIIPPVPKDELIKELTPERLLRKTNKAENEIYLFTANEAPALMREVGRLREMTFREAGGGTGKEIDIDSYDTSSKPYTQLIVWDPQSHEILGGYRYIVCDDIEFLSNGEPNLATARMFKFSDDFIKDILPKTIELGRSFVQPDYQSSKMGAKALFALDNLWDGLGALTVENKQIEYFFGKVTMYTHFNIEARNLILCFLRKHFGDQNNWVHPKDNYLLKDDISGAGKVFIGEDFKEDYKILSKGVRDLGENIPPLINAYMSLSPSMRTFGTAVNDHFGDVEETGIIVTIEDIYDTKRERYIETYENIKNDGARAMIH